MEGNETWRGNGTKDRREHACGMASGHKSRNLRHRSDVRAQIHPCDVLRHAIFNFAHALKSG